MINTSCGHKPIYLNCKNLFLLRLLLSADVGSLVLTNKNVSVCPDYFPSLAFAVLYLCKLRLDDSVYLGNRTTLMLHSDQ